MPTDEIDPQIPINNFLSFNIEILIFSPPVNFKLSYYTIILFVVFISNIKYS